MEKASNAPGATQSLQIIVLYNNVRLVQLRPWPREQQIRLRAAQKAWTKYSLRSTSRHYLIRILYNKYRRILRFRTSSWAWWYQIVEVELLSLNRLRKWLETTPSWVSPPLELVHRVRFQVPGSRYRPLLVPAHPVSILVLSAQPPCSRTRYQRMRT